MLCIFRRVHITDETARFLNNDYKIDPGNGGERNSFLRDHNITTFLICVSEHSKVKVSLYCYYKFNFHSRLYYWVDVVAI